MCYLLGTGLLATRASRREDSATMRIENVENAGGYPAFVEARVEAAVLAELTSRGGKLPDELICVAVEFLGLELPRWKPAPKKQ